MTASSSASGRTRAAASALKAVQVEALGRRRDELLGRVTGYAAANGLDLPSDARQSRPHARVHGPRHAVDVLAGPRAGGLPGGARGAGASTDALWTFIDRPIGWGTYTDQGNEPYIPYYFQAATQLGYPDPAFRHVRKLRRYRGIYQAKSFIPHFYVRFDRWAMPDIDRWVRFASSELMFVYAENDPWSAERFAPSRWTRDTHLYVAPGARHSTGIVAAHPRGPGRGDRDRSALGRPARCGATRRAARGRAGGGGAGRGRRQAVNAAAA